MEGTAPIQQQRQTTVNNFFQAHQDIGPTNNGGVVGQLLKYVLSRDYLYLPRQQFQKIQLDEPYFGCVIDDLKSFPKEFKEDIFLSMKQQIEDNGVLARNDLINVLGTEFKNTTFFQEPADWAHPLSELSFKKAVDECNNIFALHAGAGQLKAFFDKYWMLLQAEQDENRLAIECLKEFQKEVFVIYNGDMTKQWVVLVQRVTQFVIGAMFYSPECFLVDDRQIIFYKRSNLPTYSLSWEGFIATLESPYAALYKLYSANRDHNDLMFPQTLGASIQGKIMYTMNDRILKAKRYNILDFPAEWNLIGKASLYRLGLIKAAQMRKMAEEKEKEFSRKVAENPFFRRKPVAAQSAAQQLSALTMQSAANSLEQQEELKDGKNGPSVGDDILDITEDDVDDDNLQAREELNQASVELPLIGKRMAPEGGKDKIGGADLQKKSQIAATATYNVTSPDRRRYSIAVTDPEELVSKTTRQGFTGANGKKK